MTLKEPAFASCQAMKVTVDQMSPVIGLRNVETVWTGVVRDIHHPPSVGKSPGKFLT